MTSGKRIILAIIGLLATGCAAAPQKAIFNTDETQLELRSYQSRVIESTSEIEMMRNVVETLQDLGLLVENADAGLGTVTGKRFQSGLVTLTVTVRPRGNDAVVVRANAQRGDERIDDPEVYQTFFNALQQSGFISTGRID
jgi:hypothetical protein